MNKFEKIEKKLNISKNEEIIVPIYSEDAFIKCALGTIDDFCDLPCVEDIAYQYLENLKNTTLEKVSFRVIDENYFDWLKNNNLTNSKINIQKYIDFMPVKLNEKLWEKYEYNYGYDWGILPLIFENPTYTKEGPKDIEFNFILSDKSLNILQESAYNSFTNYNENNVKFDIEKKDIYISPYIISIDSFNDDLLINNLFNDGCIKLHGETPKYDKKRSIQKLKAHLPLDFFGVFVMYRYKVPSTIDNQHIEYAKNTTINRPDMDIDIFEETLKNDINIVFEMLTSNLIYPEAVPAAITEFAEIISEQVSKKIKTIDDMNAMMMGHCKNSDKKKK